ncbi:MAG: T9SS type A sorting domain-containing protein [Bacteroidia bacterium]
MKFTYFVIGLLLSTVSLSQGLLPTINSGILPNNSDPICQSSWYTISDFDTSGYDVGETVNDFTLFDLNGNAFQLSTALALGKPVLLIAGSVTCPYFRDHVATINYVASTYASYINTTLVYLIEAHPTDTCPYSGHINVPPQNFVEGLLFPQPTTYLGRKNLVDTLFQRLTVIPPLYIDGPCNEYWHHFGPAPQNAYLIDTNGVVLLKHGWFNNFPQNIYCDIDSVLGINSGNCVSTATNGTFTFAPTVTSVNGIPGQTIYDTGDLINTGTSDVLIEVIKLQENYAPGWNSALCMSICYSSSVDSVTFLLEANDTMHFSLDYFTSQTADSSRVRVGFMNEGFPANHFIQLFKGYTSVMTGTQPVETASFEIYPNPCTSDLHFVNNEAQGNDDEYFIYDLNGKLQKKISSNTAVEFSIDVSDLSQGVYFIEQRGAQASSYVKFVKY